MLDYMENKSLKSNMESKDRDDCITKKIEDKKRVLTNLRKMHTIAINEYLSSNLIAALKDEINFCSPQNVTREELYELELREWEDRQLDPDTFGKEFHSEYKLKEHLEDGTVNIW